MSFVDRSTYHSVIKEEGTYGGDITYGLDLQISLPEAPGLLKENYEVRQAIRDAMEKVKNTLFLAVMRTDQKYVDALNARKAKLLESFGPHIYAKEIPNEYGNKEDAFYIMQPWFLVTTRIGTFKVGPRKRVWHLEWTETEQKLSAEDLFPDEEVTKFDRVIHVYNYAKLTEYVNRVMTATEPTPKEPKGVPQV